MSTYRIIEYIKTGNIYVAVFSHGSREHQVTVTAVLNTDGSVHIEHTKNSISRRIIEMKKEIDQAAPGNAGSISGHSWQKMLLVR